MKAYMCNKCGAVGDDLHFVKTHACVAHSAAVGFSEVHPPAPPLSEGRVVAVPTSASKVRRER